MKPEDMVGTVVGAGRHGRWVNPEYTLGRHLFVINIHVYCIAPPGGGVGGYYKSAVEMICNFALHTCHSASALLTRTRGRGQGLLLVSVKPVAIRAPSPTSACNPYYDLRTGVCLSRYSSYSSGPITSRLAT